MIVPETATHQTTVEFKLLQVPLRPSIINQSPYHNGSCKKPRNKNVKLYIKHDNRPNLLQTWWTNNDNWLIQKPRQPLGHRFYSHWATSSWRGTGTLLCGGVKPVGERSTPSTPSSGHLFKLELIHYSWVSFAMIELFLTIRRSVIYVNVSVTCFFSYFQLWFKHFLQNIEYYLFLGTY